MLYSLDDIKKDVRALMDMNLAATAGVDTDTLMVDTLTERLVCLAVRMAETRCPQSMLTGGVDMTASATIQTDGDVNYIVLPETFMRLVDLKMTSWTMPAPVFITETDEAYRVLRSDFTGIRATVRTPVCALVHREGLPAIELYPTATDDSLAYGHYLELPTIENGKTDICPMCYDGAVTYTAALVSEVLRDGRASDLSATAAALLNLTTNNKTEEQ